MDQHIKQKTNQLEGTIAADYRIYTNNRLLMEKTVVSQKLFKCAFGFAL